jgi:hypothetical protein
MLFGETVTVYCENHTEHTDTLCGQNAEFYCVETGGIYSFYCVFLIVKFLLGLVLSVIIMYNCE